MSATFTFQTVPRIHFGPDSLDQIRSEVARLGDNLLLIAGRHVVRQTELIDRIRRLCHEAGVKSVVFDAPPEGEPDLQSVERARQWCRETGAGLVVAIGGGSILDLAKAVAGLAHEHAIIDDYFAGMKVQHAGIPWIAIPTVAGSGAEVTKNAVLTDARTNRKQSIRDDRFFASAVIVDPKLMLSCPPRVTADSGTDALAQAIEAYTSLGATPLTDAIALEAARQLLEHLPAAYQDGADLDARSGTALGSLMAGIALANARLGAIHGIAHPIGARWNIPHGRVCATLLAPVMRFNQDAAAPKYQRLSEAAGRPIIDHVEQLRADLDIPADFAALAITGEELDWIIRESLPSGSLKMNPRPVDAGDLRHILEPLIRSS